MYQNIPSHDRANIIRRTDDRPTHEVFMNQDLQQYREISKVSTIESQHASIQTKVKKMLDMSDIFKIVVPTTATTAPPPKA
jgi:IS1 family transposase